jgi:DNA replication protein DnaC
LLFEHDRSETTWRPGVIQERRRALEHHLKELRLPTILREYDKVARQCAVEQVDYARYLLRMTELELLDRERRATERRIRQAKFPVVKTMDSFDFLAMPSLNKTMVLELARCEFLARRENVLLLGNSGTGKTGGPSDRSSSLGWKTHIALALGLAACQRGHRVRFTTASALVSELIEARDEKKLLRFQKQIASYELLIVDELGFVPLSKTGAELLFEMLSQRYERGSTMVTSNLPFQEWAEVLGSERLTGALLDPLTHHVHILEMNRDRYRLKQSRRKHGSQTGVLFSERCPSKVRNLLLCRTSRNWQPDTSRSSQVPISSSAASCGSFISVVQHRLPAINSA